MVKAHITQFITWTRIEGRWNNVDRITCSYSVWKFSAGIFLPRNYNVCIHNPHGILTPRSGLRWHIIVNTQQNIHNIITDNIEAFCRWQKKCMNKILLHFTAKILSGPRLRNCTVCHDWSMGNGAWMVQVNSNYGRTYTTVYTAWYNIIY